jgi:hypothetical protein
MGEAHDLLYFKLHLGLRPFTCYVVDGVTEYVSTGGFDLPITLFA